VALLAIPCTDATASDLFGPSDGLQIQPELNVFERPSDASSATLSTVSSTQLRCPLDIGFPRHAGRSRRDDGGHPSARRGWMKTAGL